MFKDGCYRIYRIHHGHGKPIDQLVARFFIKGRELNILEDYDNLLEDNMMEGPVDATHEKFLSKLQHSGYYKLIHEKEGNEGLHDHMIDDLDIGPIEPDASYLIQEGSGEPKILEMFGENGILEGKKLLPDELSELMSRIHTGKAKMGHL
jgi:hypothetical protein